MGVWKSWYGKVGMERWYGKGGMERVVKSKQSFDLIRITLALFLVWEGWYGISGV